jgi:NADH-quinone oxidoreductase subunit M
MDRMGGLWSAAPRMGGMGLLFALASLGLPGFGNFIAEFMVLAGTFPVDRTITAFAALGLVLAAVYSLWMVQRTFQGRPGDGAASLPDLSVRETGILAVLAAAILWLGLYPQPVLDRARPALNTLQYIAPSEERLDAKADVVPANSLHREQERTP